MKFYQMFCQQCGEKIFIGRNKDKEKIKDKKLLENIKVFEESHKNHKLKIVEYRIG